MGLTTGIDWTDATHNFWVGCEKVSEGCKFCYMFRDMDFHKMDPKDIHRTQLFNNPLKWSQEPRKVFINSWSDFFLKQADPWRDAAWDVIRRTPWITWQILTKRIERVKNHLPSDWGHGWPNVWIGASTENQPRYDQRTKYFDKFEAAVKFLSIEPLLGPIPNMRLGGDLDGLIDWVILGGESGNDTGKWGYRPAYLQWFKEIIDQCDAENVPVFMKQTGTYIAKQMEMQSRTGKLTHEWPEEFRRREFPKVV